MAFLPALRPPKRSRPIHQTRPIPKLRSSAQIVPSPDRSTPEKLRVGSHDLRGRSVAVNPSFLSTPFPAQPSLRRPLHRSSTRPRPSTSFPTSPSFCSDNVSSDLHPPGVTSYHSLKPQLQCHPRAKVSQCRSAPALPVPPSARHCVLPLRLCRRHPFRNSGPPPANDANAMRLPSRSARRDCWGRPSRRGAHPVAPRPWPAPVPSITTTSRAGTCQAIPSVQRPRWATRRSCARVDWNPMAPAY